MKKWLVLLLTVSTLLLLGLLSALPAAANGSSNTYYVSPAGSDLGAGSEASPWQTLSFAVSEASGEDTILVMDDNDETTVDYQENVIVDKPLTIERYDDVGPNPQIQAGAPDQHVFDIVVNDVILRGLDIFGATDGGSAAIHLRSTSHCTIENNRCGWDETHWNRWGIAFYNSTENILVGNTCSYNKYHGIRLCYSCNNNFIFLNTLSDNGLSNAFSGGSASTWHSPVPLEYEYDGVTYTNYLGNDYGDYLGNDADGDGIGDTPYQISIQTDDYPLVDSRSTYVVTGYEPDNPLPEVSTFILFGIGMIGLAGYVGYRRVRSAARAS